MLNKKMNRKQKNIKAIGAPLLGALSLGLALLAGPAAHAAPTTHPLPHRIIWGSGPSIRKSVILKLSGPLTAARQAALTKLGASVTRHFDFISSVAADVPGRRLAQVAALPFVTHVSEDGQVKKCDDFTEGASGDTAAFQQYGLTGQGVIAVVLDSGVAANPDLDTRYYNAVSFVPGDPSPADKCGHGTHVAGIIAGSGVSSTGPGFKHTFHGIARGAFIANVRVLDDKGQGTVSSVLSGIQYVLAIKAQYKYTHPVVMNLSLGHPVGESYTTDPLCQAVEAAWKAGVVVVCAAGNSGRASTASTSGAANEGWGTAYGSVQSPGNDPYVITVGAAKSLDGVHAHDRIATYSSRGPSRLDFVLKPDIIAPGNKVISLNAPGSYLSAQFAVNDQVPMSYYAPVGVSGQSTNYLQLSGTSMAAPVVAGAAALLLQANPTLSPDSVKARLMVSADKWTSPTGVADPCTYGAGYLNIPAALQSVVTATQPALSPLLSRDASGTVSINGAGVLSNSHVIWGSGINDLHVIWGSTALTGSSLSNALSNTTASHVIWGSSLWADHVIWGTSTDAVDLSTAAYGE